MRQVPPDADCHRAAGRGRPVDAQRCGLADIRALVAPVVLTYSGRVRYTSLQDNSHNLPTASQGPPAFPFDSRSGCSRSSCTSTRSDAVCHCLSHHRSLQLIPLGCTGMGAVCVWGGDAASAAILLWLWQSWVLRKMPQAPGGLPFIGAPPREAAPCSVCLLTLPLHTRCKRTALQTAGSLPFILLSRSSSGTPHCAGNAPAWHSGVQSCPNPNPDVPTLGNNPGSMFSNPNPYVPTNSQCSNPTGLY